MTTDDLKRRTVEAIGWARANPLIALGVLVLVAVLGLAAFGKLESTYSHARDWLFDKRAERAEAERDTLRTERDAAIKRAEAAEAQAAVLEESAAAQKKLAEDKGTTAREKVQRAEEIEHETETAVDAARNLPPDAARDLIRRRLAELYPDR